MYILPYIDHNIII